MFVNVLHKIERTLGISITQVIAELVFSRFLLLLVLLFAELCSFSPSSLFLFCAFMASSGDRLLISPDGLLSLWDVMESFRCVSRIARRFSILLILPSPSSLSSFSLSLSFSFFCSRGHRLAHSTFFHHVFPPTYKCAWAADSAARIGRIRERMQKMKKKTREGFFYSRNACSNMNMHWLTRNCELLLRGQHCSRLFIISASIV